MNIAAHSVISALNLLIWKNIAAQVNMIHAHNLLNLDEHSRTFCDLCSQPSSSKSGLWERNKLPGTIYSPCTLKHKPAPWQHPLYILSMASICWTWGVGLIYTRREHLQTCSKELMYVRRRLEGNMHVHQKENTGILNGKAKRISQLTSPKYPRTCLKI